MLKKLKQHWEVNTKELILILCTFAITGTLTAWLSKKVAEWLFLDKYGFAWWASKIVILIFGYQVIILIVGFCFGMFSFFWKYEKKILARLGFFEKSLEMKIKAEPLVAEHPHKANPDTGPLFFENKKNSQTEKKLRIAIFASGAGSNAQKIIDHFRNSGEAEIALIVCNQQKAGVLSIAEKEGIPVLFIQRNLLSATGYVEALKKEHIDVIVLAGFLWQIPPSLIKAFPKKIINIHPALLPAYGGKGMYGNAVHQAVIDAQEPESGITIHFVDEKYDHGEIIFQAKSRVSPNDTIDSLKNKIHLLEHEHFPKVIEKVIMEIRKTR